ncbi:dihydroneopterin aldolase, partial [Brevibacterium epidermidis]
MTGTEAAPDRIELRGLTVRGNHGVFDFEKREGQDFVIDVTLHTSVARAAATDDLAETIHYGELAEDVAGIVENNTFDLIETLAERIADHCLSLCEHVEVVVHKPSAPIQRTFDDVRIRVERSRTTASAGE